MNGFARPGFMIIVIIFILGSANIFGAVEVDDPWEKAQQESFFALNGTKVFHIPGQLETTVNERIGMMKELGVLWDRSDWWWHVIEPEPGKFDFSFPDKAVKYFEKNHIQIYPILCYGAAWWEGHNAPTEEEHFKNYGEYVYQTVKRYKDHFTYWSVWNEPNIRPFWTPEPNPDHYAKLLKIAYRAAKKADPECRICAPVVAPLGEWDQKFVERLYQLGCKDYFDVFDYHYYRNNPPEKEVPAELADIRALMNRYGDDKPIWISETGVSGMIAGKPESYEKQAALVVRNQLLCLASGVKRIFYFDLQNWNDKPEEAWDSKLGLIEADGDPKHAFHAYRTMVKEVDYNEVIGHYVKEDQGWRGVLVYDEEKNDYIMAAWVPSPEKKKTVEFLCEPGDVKIVHPYGDVEIRGMKQPPLPDKNSRKVELELDNNPCFIHHVDMDAYLPETAVRLDPEKIIMNPGEERKLTLLKKRLPGEVTVHYKNVEVPEGLEWNKEKGMILADRNMDAGERTIMITAELEYGDQELRKTAMVESAATVEILPVLDMSLRPWMDSGQLKIQAALTNQSQWDVSGDLELIADNEKKEVTAKKTDFILKAGNDERVGFSAEEAGLTHIQKSLILRLKLREYTSSAFRIAVFPLREDKPEIDGRIDEWEGILPVRVGSEEKVTRGEEGWTPREVSGEIRLWFTEDMMYFAGDITDDDPVRNSNPANMLWKGDAIELYMGFGGPAKRSVLNKDVDYQIGIAPDYEKGGPVVFLFHLDKVLTEAKTSVRKTSDGYVIEAGIPLETFGVVNPETMNFLGFDVALDDLDEGDWAPEGNTPGRAVVWNGTGRNWIDPSNWGMVVLNKE